MSKNNSAVLDEDGETPDWFEIYNHSSYPINLGDYYLTDDVTELHKWNFPDGYLGPDSHIVVFASDKNRTLWPEGHWIPIINFGANWHYMPGNSEIPSNWNTLQYDIVDWYNGPSAIGYGDNDDMTVIDPVLSIFMRVNFEVYELDNVLHGLLHMDYDDGFIVYINGSEVLRENLGNHGTEVEYDQYADANVEAKIYRGLEPEKFLIDDIVEYLVEGQNVLAVQVHNANENYNDLTALPILSFYVEEPPPPSESYEVKISINTDSYPSETSWELVGINGNEYIESIPVGSMPIVGQYEWTLDVPIGDYSFTILDTWGDGICCEDGVPVEVYNSGWESDGGWNVWPPDVSNDNWEHAQGQGYNESYRALELFGTTSTGYVAFWQEVPAYPGELHHLSVYAKQTSENPLQTGQTAHANIEFWGWSWGTGAYMISQHFTEFITSNSQDDTWIKLDVAALAPNDAANTHVVVVFNNPTGNPSGSVLFDEISYRSNVHSASSDFYVSGDYSITVDGSLIVQGGAFTESSTHSFNTENLLSDLLNYQNPYLHTNFRITSEGETVFLSDQENNLIDTMFIPEMEQDLSYGYYNDGGGFLALFNEPTPGATNNTSESFYGYTEDPEFSHGGGFMDQFFDLFIISATENASIYYTTDGSKPDESSNLYSGYISIDNNLLLNGTQTADDYGIDYFPTHDGIIIRAVAIAPNHIPSRVISNSFIFDSLNSTLPVISIAIDPDDMWDPNIGMHVTGDAFWPWYPFYGSNFWQDWEKEVHLEFFEPGGNIGFKQDAGMKIFGGWSRAEAQKSFSFFARNIYGKGNFEYSLFPDSDVNTYESFILRAHGQDNVMFRDGFHTSLAAESGVAVQDYRPAVVYLNGEFWGIQNIREKVNEHYIETHYGIDTDNLDLLSTIATTEEPELIHGSTEDYLEIREFVSNNDLAIDANYTIAAQHYDVDNLIDYKIAQIFIMNFDWPGNNNKLFKAKSNDGKWKHIMFDSDFGFSRWTDLAIGFIGSYETYNMLDHAYGDGNVFNNPVWSTSIFTSFLDNPSFRNKFINTYCDRINTTYSTENSTHMIDSLRLVIDSYIESHINRYGPSPYDSYTPNTLTDYNSAVQLMYDFAEYRPDNARNEMVDIFNLAGDLNRINLFVNDSEAGHIRINSLDIYNQNWSGEYFSDVPITIKAVPHLGYEFSHWTNQPDYGDSINLLLNQNMTMIAHFIELDNPYQNMIAINEINYHSSDDFDPDDWIELYNYSDMDIDLSQWKFMDSNESNFFTISDGLIIESGGYLVLCQDSSKFSELFPEIHNYIGETGFGLSAGGELIRLYDESGNLVDFVEYDDENPWSIEADGGGHTLELLNPELDNSMPESWTFSGNQNGSPGQQNASYEALANDDDETLPSVFAIHQNFPNPFNPYTNISYDLPKDNFTTISIYNLMGKHVKTLIDQEQSAGYKTLRWDAKNQNGNNVSAGVYIYQIKSGPYLSSKKMVLLK